MSARERMSAPALAVMFATLSMVAGAREDQILTLGNPAGAQTVTEQSGATRAEDSYNDRGRGDHIIATWQLDAAGVIAPGRLADLILVDGDPGTQIADINKVTLVMKGGRIYDPAHIEQALGIAPRDHS